MTREKPITLERIQVTDIGETVIEICRQHFDVRMKTRGDWFKAPMHGSIFIEKDPRVIRDLIAALHRVSNKLDAVVFVNIPCISGSEEVQAPSVSNVMKTKEVSLTEENPIPFILSCPACGTRHIDEGEFATKPHRTHACQHCGVCWRPAVVATVGVRFLPGFKNGDQ